jgi:hypothetical protein
VSQTRWKVLRSQNLSGNFQAMKNTKLFIVAASLLFSFQAFATSTICTKDKLERKVEASVGKPCEVKYFKESHSEGIVLWSAKNNAHYCEEKAAEFIQKLGSDGWNCSGSQTSSAVTTEQTDSTATVAPEAKKE